ncbi:hypothetical protein FKP32DRAFT_153088 [Trametes sanguinea]|nr:hypothetical protein FKP32DRAFT_153088 [Trametes sanguinea]
MVASASLHHRATLLPSISLLLAAMEVSTPSLPQFPSDFTFSFALPRPPTAGSLGDANFQRNGTVNGQGSAAGVTASSVMPATQTPNTAAAGTVPGLLGRSMSRLEPPAMPAEDHNSKNSLLVMQPFDVQSVILSLLPNGSLAVLRLTCRHFARAAGRALVQCGTRSRKFYRYAYLISFIQFLNSRWSHSFADLVQELHFSEHIFSSVDEAYGRLSGGLGATVLQAIHLCRNLRRLHIEEWDSRWKTGLFSKAICRLSFLEDLSVRIRADIQPDVLRMLLNRRLRRLSLSGEGARSLPFDALPPTLEALELYDTPLWSLPSTVLLPSLESLTVCFPVSPETPALVKLKTCFPNLRHLRLQGWMLPCSTTLSRYTFPRGKSEYDALRRAYRMAWDAQPDQWPDLLSITADDPAQLHALAIPRHVPHLSVRSRETSAEAKHVLATVLSDTRPASLDYRWEVTSRGPRGHGAGVPCDMFEVLSTCPSLRRYALQLGCYRDLWERSFKDRDEMIKSCLKHVAQSRVTHLLIRDPHKYFIIPPAPFTYLPRPQSEEVELIEVESSRLAQALFKASPTLVCVGLWVDKHSLRVWRAQRPYGDVHGGECVVKEAVQLSADERLALFDVPVDDR